MNENLKGLLMLIHMSEAEKTELVKAIEGYASERYSDGYDEGCNEPCYNCDY